ncbi:dipeptide epimerase [Lacticaseibacillus sp. GG6-2]
MTRIKTIQGRLESVPLTHPFTTAKHTVLAADSVAVDVTLEDGRVGHGAATPNAVVTGDTLNTVLTIIDDVIAPALVGRDSDDFNALQALLQRCILHNTPAKAAVEIALYDLRAQRFGVPLVTLLGARSTPVVTDFTIGIAALDDMIAEAKAKVYEGFGALKIKLGTVPLAEDIARVTAIANAVGRDVHLRLDANQAWSPKEARNATAAFARSGLLIDFIEQPVAAADLAGLAAVTAVSPIPIMADECVHSFADAQAVVAAHAADYVNIKLMKTGGLGVAEQINGLCAANGIACMLGCMIESQTSLAAAVAFAASHDNVRFADLDAVYMIDAQDTPAYLSLQGPQITLTHAVGL